MSKRLTFPALLACSLVYSWYTHTPRPAYPTCTPYTYVPRSDRKITATLYTPPGKATPAQKVGKATPAQKVGKATPAQKVGKGGLSYPTLADRVRRADTITTHNPTPITMSTTVQGRGSGLGYTVQGYTVHPHTGYISTPVIISTPVDNSPVVYISTVVYKGRGR